VQLAVGEDEEEPLPNGPGAAAAVAEEDARLELVEVSSLRGNGRPSHATTFSDAGASCQGRLAGTAERRNGFFNAEIAEDAENAEGTAPTARFPGLRPASVPVKTA